MKKLALVGATLVSTVRIAAWIFWSFAAVATAFAEEPIKDRIAAAERSHYASIEEFSTISQRLPNNHDFMSTRPNPVSVRRTVASSPLGTSV
jgi:hypothetical protein